MPDVIPTLHYADAHAAIDFLERAFGFTRRAVYDGPDGTVAHAELTFGNDGLVMLGSAREPEGPWPARVGAGATYVVVADPDAHHDRAVAAGAQVVMTLTDQEYGSREYAVSDPEANLWSFGTYRPGTS